MSAYVDENGLLIDDEGNPVEEPVDAWAVRDSLQDAQRGAPDARGGARGMRDEA